MYNLPKNTASDEIYDIWHAENNELIPPDLQMMLAEVRTDTAGEKYDITDLLSHIKKPTENMDNPFFGYINLSEAMNPYQPNQITDIQYQIEDVVTNGQGFESFYDMPHTSLQNTLRKMEKNNPSQIRVQVQSIMYDLFQD